MTSFAAVCIGGPCAGEAHIRPGKHLQVVVAEPLPPLTAYNNDAELTGETPVDRFEYRYTQLGGHALWVPHDWTLELVMAELLTHYQKQAGVRRRD